MLSALALSLIGLLVLSFSADQFVQGAARLATVLRLAPIVVGAVVVGFGTSAAEMLVSALAAVNGQLGIGVGNIIGSNVANISLVLAAASFVAAVPVAERVVRRDAAVSVASVAAFALAIFTGASLERWEGATLLALLGAWFVFALRGARGDASANLDDISGLLGDDAPTIGKETARSLVSLALVALSAWVLVEGAVRLADELGLSGGLVGYTLVAAGTSAPELVTAVAAARRRQNELLVGNLLGSNVFNSLAVGGVIGVIGPGAVDRDLRIEGAASMLLICAVSWRAMAVGNRVGRGTGTVLMALWVASVVLLAS